MNKLLLSTALVAALGAFAVAPAANAANSGTINITGQVVADSCVISVNGSTTSTVTLPTVTTNVLSTVGATAGDKSFDVSLTGCDSALSTAAMSFANTNVNVTSGNLNNTASSGSNVQVQLLSGGSVMNLNTNSNTPTIAISGGKGTASLTARYVAATAAATAGAVSTSASFTLTYN